MNNFAFSSVATDTLRIRIFDLYKPDRATVSAEGGLLITPKGTRSIEYARAQPARITRVGGQVKVADGTGGEIVSDRIGIEAADGMAISVHVNDRSDKVREYSGTVTVRIDPKRRDGLVLINAVPIEDYVAAVVATEYGLNDTEGSRAMAVLARTYALRSKNTAAGDYDHVDHSMSQVFHGVGSISERSYEAANSTRGQILVHHGELVESVYHASSGGRTASNEDVWNGAPVAYLRGRRDRYENSPYKSWTTRVSRDRLLTLFSNHSGKPVTGITVDERSSDGRVRTMILHTRDGEQQLSANDFRLVFRREFGVSSLRSTLFKVRREGNEYVFAGNGFGHGVGLSQWGAHEMAKAGKSYTDILNYYYADVSLVSIDGVGVGDQLQARPVAPLSEPVRKETGKRRGW